MEFEPVTELEFEKDLIGLPITLVKENIRSQLLDEFDRTDYLSITLHQIDAMKDIYGNSGDFLHEIEEFEIDLCSFVVLEIEKAFNIHISIDYDNIPKARKFATTLYNYLIVNHYNNLKTFIMEYIISNRKAISDNYKKLNKDVTTSKIKKIKKSKMDRVISANVPEIINNILDEAKTSMTSETFLDYASYSSYDSISLKEAYDNGIMDGEFMTVFACRHKFTSIVNQLKNDVYYTLLK